ncbi:hypothetical protein AGOR_G00206140 [Albula goreensis]|uniref:Uncharacterized protein n=1 Tax=Albula goreensis TaxID=1534307 RepID=A0A8T3CKP4_9TELE|nr:hypothetical protein AGOR_G00206140 [Albula goreensis]
MITIKELLAFFVICQVVCPPVLEKYEEYACEAGKQSFDIVYIPKDLNISKCEQSWQLGEKPIADCHRNQCIEPCVQVSSGEIHLTQCANVTLILFCNVHGGMVEEVRVHFTGKTSTWIQGQKNHHIGLLATVIFLLILGVVTLVLYMRKTTAS